MKLMEIFAGQSDPVQDDIDWMGDLKFFIDNSDELLEKYILPAVKLQEKHIKNPNVYKVYLEPLQKCLDVYIDKFKIEDADTKFPDDAIVELAKHIAGVQHNFLTRGDYAT